ncbi:TetR/AcrR family transcriptional regulator [Mucilaginibacter sp. 21P]|uniref:TetR/AcrR family transcriptional regulator n=1 Tax=Mucilaginibacter sp. 21P TaxID=2778902 RepID=UPI001C59F5F2|nr:TetR/AcrR family transcriptional regulator [Mucilaginibacter sp. 21P]QXV63775.1 TetR/AcrR family transcriptional regulator [Mucilaginibacter sp. 21P]
MAKASKEKIIQVTKDMLMRLPMADVTVREIAKAAGVNIAAIHYYFSTKEILYNAAIEKIMTRNIDYWLMAHPMDKLSGINPLIDLVVFLHEGCIRYPEFARTRVWNTLGSDQANDTNQKVFLTMLETAEKLNLEKDTDRLKLKVSLLYASLASISASSADLNAFNGLQLNNEASLRSYVKEIVEIIFHKNR